MIRSYTLLIFVFVLVAHSYAQPAFEGTITYDVTYRGDHTVQAFLSLLPKTSTIHVKDQKTRVDQYISGGGQQSYIVDNTTGATTLLMTLMGQSFQVPMDRADLETLQPIYEMSFVHTAETKDVVGYSCSHAYAVIEGDTIDVFYTNAIKTPLLLPAFRAIDGIPLEYQVRQDHMVISFECISLIPKVLSSDLFDIASEIKAIPFEIFARTFAVMK